MSDLVLDAVDSAAREEVLDIRRSFIVQAPAGSGKTDLLTRRFLRLLATVDEPEEILAITFTRSATAEMRGRILADLEAVAAGRTFRPEDFRRMTLAREALAHAERRGWNLLAQPHRLAVETIDSLCLRIAHDRPLLGHLGGHLQPIEEARNLYNLAARRTLERLGGADPILDRALNHLLDLRDNRLAACESLLAEMLSVRDQWQHAFPLFGRMSEEDWNEARARLQAPFQREVQRVLAKAHRLLADQPAIVEQLLRLAHYAAEHGNDDVAPLARVDTLSPDLSLEQWRGLCGLLLTGDNAWRKSVNVHQGFPPRGRDAREQKDAMLHLLGWLQHKHDLLAALGAIRDLPPPVYSEEQWTTLRHIFTALRQAIVELRVVFAERNAVDFTEVSLAALDVLRDRPERLLDLSGNLHHLLIDEFQDTSRRQHELVCALLAAWDPGEKRSVFLVGDPMQSIYMFRQAEVELFSHVRDHGLGLLAPLDSASAGCIPCKPVQLSVNYRSHSGLTTPLNRIFSAICADEPPPGAAGVRFAPATSAEIHSSPLPLPNAVHIHPQLLVAEERQSGSEPRQAPRQEALEILRILEDHLPRINQARDEGREYRVAVLVRARNHLAELVPLLRERRIPFRAVEIEHLAERPELLDLLSLTRALVHPMDRIPWLAVLRAPWCGLSLADLHRLTGADDPTMKDLSVLELIDRNRQLLSADGQRRLVRTAEILRHALDLRWRPAQSPSFSSWIERTWRTLGGAACVEPAAEENAQVFFSLLDAVAPDGLAPFTGDFAADCERLFAQPDPAVSEACGIQLMTIHKAKGLGFDVVLVPGLDRPAATDPRPLVCSLERIDPWVSDAATPGETEFLVAPLGPQGEDKHPLYKWVRQQRQMRFDEERKRLLYVACTRARRELHLFGAAVATAGGVQFPNRASLLATAWPALQSEFEAARLAAEAATPTPRVLHFPAAAMPEEGVLEEIAAVADPASRPSPRRLRLDEEPLPAEPNVTTSAAFSSQSESREFLRPQGSRRARLVGSAVHALLQRLGPGLAAMDPAQLRALATAQLRAAALTGEPLASATAEVTKLLRACAADPVCQWILASHPEAQSEAAWSSSEPGARLRTLRADRVFRAGPEPLVPGEDYFWVIDYKTSAAPSGALFLQTERALYEPQLLAYAHAIRALYGPAVPLRLGLYYPALAALDFWDPGATPEED